jgi:hypothetical protein
MLYAQVLRRKWHQALWQLPAILVMHEPQVPGRSPYIYQSVGIHQLHVCTGKAPAAKGLLA